MFFNVILNLDLSAINVGGSTIKKLKALFLTLWFYTFLLWFYIVARIVVDDVPLYSLFLNRVPFFTFIGLGVIAFLLSMIFMYLYLIMN
jgi:hypothetical protein